MRLVGITVSGLLSWCTSAITLGTMFGGWRIIKTLGFGLFKVKLTHSVANQLGSALVNTMAAKIGVPTLTSKVDTVTLIGSGAEERPMHDRWRTVEGIVSSWYFNLPVSIFLDWIYCLINNVIWS